jgi:AcrR family transcriptional regulator
MEAARQVFTAEGYRAATVDGIAAAAGFTKGAFYRHFSSKAAAYAAVLEHAAGDAWRVGTARVAGAHSVEEAVAEYVDLVIAFYQRAPFRIGTQLEALVEAEHDPGMRDSVAAAFASGRNRLATALERAAAREQGAPVLAADDLAALLIANTIGAVSQWRVDPEAFDLERWGRTTKSTVGAAVAAAPATPGPQRLFTRPAPRGVE